MHCATLSLQHRYDVGKRYHITMPPQSQYVIGLYRDIIQQKTDVATISGAHWDITLLLLKVLEFLLHSAFFLEILEVLRNLTFLQTIWKLL